MLKRVLTDSQAKTIRERYADGTTMIWLQKEYGVSCGVISNVINGRTYKNAGGPIKDPMAPKNGSVTREDSRLFYDDQIVQMREKYANNLSVTYTDLAEEYGVTLETVSRILRGVIYKDVAGPLKLDKVRHRARC